MDHAAARDSVQRWGQEVEDSGKAGMVVEECALQECVVNAPRVLADS